MSENGTAAWDDSQLASESKPWIKTFVLTLLAMLAYGYCSTVLPYTMMSIQEELKINSTTTGGLVSMFLIGNMIGGFLGGWAADIFGRTKVLAISILWGSIIYGLLSFVSTYVGFSILLVIGSIGLGSIYIVGLILVSESVNSKYRSRIMSSLMVGFILGSILTAYLAGTLSSEFGWRALFQICFVPMILAILIWFLVPETDSWKLLKKLKAENKTKKIKQTSPFRLIIKDKQILKIFAFWMLCGGALQFGYMGLSTWLPSYFEKGLNLTFKDMTMYMIVSYSISICTKLVAGYLADKFGRRPIYTLGTLGTAIALPILIFFNTPGNIIILVIFFSLLYAIPFGIVSTYMTESFPTAIRGTAVGASFNLGGIVAILAPLLIGYFADLNKMTIGILFMALAYFISGLVALFLIKDRMYDPQQVD